MVDQLVNSEANARRIALVESCFGSAGQPLGVPGRVLVGEGVLTKSCRKKPKPRQFFLFNDILVYGNIILQKKKYNKQHIIPLEEVKLKSMDDDGQFKNGWLICTRGKSFAVYAATATEKQEWMAHINKCIHDLLKKPGKQASVEHAAVWVPDSEANTCMSCKKTQFTLVNRRHHCRKCGKVVCNGCSVQRFLLPAQSSKPLRVCDQCYDELAKSSNNAGFSSKDIGKTLRSDLRATIRQIPKLSKPKLGKVGRSEADAMLWWDSFDEGAQFDTTQQSIQQSSEKQRSAVEDGSPDISLDGGNFFVPTITEEPNENDSATAQVESEDNDDIKEGTDAVAYVDLREHLQLYDSKGTDSSGEDDSDDDDNPTNIQNDKTPNFYREETEPRQQ